MSAEILREAAALMRSRAEAATWTEMPWGADEVGAVWAQEADGQSVLIASRAEDADAEHIASWHPAVVLEVAEWLVGLVDAITNPDAPNAGITTKREEAAALAVARAYLGSDR